MKSGLGKIFEIPPCAHHVVFITVLLIKIHGGISKIFFLDHFSSSFLARNAKISPIFHFDLANNGQICQILCVKLIDYSI